MRFALQYSIIRFAPYVETGEFANVGILMFAPQQRFFGFKIEDRRYGRITRFFDELEPKLYRETLSQLRGEMTRIHDLLKAHGFDKRMKSNDVDFAKRLFMELIRGRESIVRFSEPRVVLADDPDAKLKSLFAYYVERNFVTKEYKESILEKGVRTWLFQAKLGNRFQRAAVGDSEYTATFPFVEYDGRQPIKVIKPLHLAQPTATQIVDHGAAWLFRVEELRRRKALPERVMFAVKGPENMDNKRTHAFSDMAGRLKDVGVQVTNFSERQQIVQFAREH